MMPPATIRRSAELEVQYVTARDQTRPEKRAGDLERLTTHLVAEECREDENAYSRSSQTDYRELLVSSAPHCQRERADGDHKCEQSEMNALIL